MAEQPFKIEIEVDVDYDVGSPPDDTVDPYVVLRPEIIRHESIWMSREGPTEGNLTSAMTGLYPPFLDATRRQVFCILCFGTPTVTWNGQPFAAGNIWLNTDPNWAIPIVLASPAEGFWFACEGELETEYRVHRQGKEEKIVL